MRINLYFIIGLLCLFAAVRCFLHLDNTIADVLLSFCWLAFSFAIPGACIFLLFSNRKEVLKVDCLTFGAASILLSVLWNCAVTLLFACAGGFSHFGLWLTHFFLISCSVYIIRSGAGLHLYNPEIKMWWLIAILAVAGVLYARPVAQVIGGRDPGVYINTGINIARTGALITQNKTIPFIPKEQYTKFLAYMYEADKTAPMFLPGFYITDFSTGEITPQFYHLYSAIFALLYPVVGVHGCLYGTPFIALLALTLVFLFLYRHIGSTVAIASTLLMMSGAHQVWYARYPNSEIFVQLCFFGALFFLSIAKKRHNGLWLLAGITLGMSFFARIDSFLIVGALLTVLFITAANPENCGKKAVIFSLTALLLFLVSHGYGYFFSNPYYMSRFGVLFQKKLVIVCGLPIITFIFMFFFLKYMKKFIPIVSNYLRYSIAVGLVLFLFAGATVLSFKTIGWFAWYLSPLILIAGSVGLLMYAMDRRVFVDHGKIIQTLVLATFSIYLIAYTPDPKIRPDHFWAIRRFTSITLPFFAIFAGYAASYLITHRYKIIRFAGGFLYLVQIGWLLAITIPTLKFAECEGILSGLKKAESYIPPKSTIVLFDATIGLYGTPIYFMNFFNHNRFIPIGQPKEFMHNTEKFERIVAPIVHSGEPVYFLSYRQIQLPFKTITAEPLLRISVPISLVEKSLENLPEKAKPIFGIPDNFLYIWQLKDNRNG